MSQEINVFKGQARRLHKHLAAAIPGFTYSQSLEATAALHGAANWRTLVGEKETAAPSVRQDMSIPTMAPESDPDQDGIIQDGGMSRVEKFLQAEREPRYFVSEGWGHIFGAGMPDSTVRFVFDMVENKIIFMDIDSWKGWVACGPDQMADVEDSLKNANDIAFNEPEDYNCSYEDSLPEWAQVDEPAQSASPVSAPEKPSNDGRYIFGEWEHHYNGMGRPLRVRFVFDTKENRLIRLQDKSDGFWEESSSALFFSVQNILLGDEDYAIADPASNDLEVSDELPFWAR